MVNPKQLHIPTFKLEFEICVVGFLCGAEVVVEAVCGGGSPKSRPVDDLTQWTLPVHPPLRLRQQLRRGRVNNHRCDAANPPKIQI